VSDGGDDQGAEEVTVHGAEEGRIIITSVLERAVSRERLFLFSAVFCAVRSPLFSREEPPFCFHTFPNNVNQVAGVDFPRP
jgi:hypothetical protein